jgi:dTDP-4-dehydrorhamnose reductase
MKIFISGADGALGREMTIILRREGIDLLATDTNQLDITDFKKTYEVLLDYKPDVILHFAAVSDVDKCEDDPEAALRVNALSNLKLGIIANKINAKLLYTSTNFVFDGNSAKPYGEYDQPNPINTYGRTKLLGEKYIKDTCSHHFIVRTSWLFGAYSKNFISRFLNSKKKPAHLDTVCDRFASFTYTRDLAQALLLIIRSKKYGVFHVVNKGVGSFSDFLLKAREIMKFNTEIRPIQAEKLLLSAQRPKYAPLASKNYEDLSNQQMRRWEDALADFVGSLSPQS